MTYASLARLREICSAGVNIEIAAQPPVALRAPEQDEATVHLTELIQGEGFISPGGANDVACILEGVEVAGQRVLDIDCGVGEADAASLRNHHAAQVTGIDI